jgi:impB/mucB/samB family
MFGCIHVPDFSVQEALFRESKSLPLALFDGPESQLKVVACNAAARSAGVSIGMSKLQAEACNIPLRRHIQEHENIAHAALIDCGYNFSPRIEVTNSGTVIIDLAGCERLMGTGRTIAQLILGEAMKRGNRSTSICLWSGLARCGRWLNNYMVWRWIWNESRETITCLFTLFVQSWKTAQAIMKH